MSTSSTATLDALAHELEGIADLPSAVNSGIVGDTAHAARGGYHISIMDQPPTNYSVIRPDDKAPPGTWPRDKASAIDTSMSTADMTRSWYRVEFVWRNRAADPRAKYFNAVNGWNGVGSAERLDFETGSRSTASDDHKWHEHLEIHRRYVNDPEMRRAMLSVHKGESVAQYLSGGTSTPTMSGESTMFLAQYSGSPAAFKGDGFRSIGIATEKAVRDLLLAGANGRFLTGYYGGGGAYGSRAEMEAAIGVVVTDPNAPAASVVLTDAQVTAIAQQIIAADTNELTAGDLDNIKAQVVAGAKQAAREGTG